MSPTTVTGTAVAPLPTVSAGSAARRVASKELGVLFGTPVAYLVIGLFVTVTLFTVFWGEAYFARNVADVRPLFEWMPLLLVFLAAALTMRLWSEERSRGTLEYVSTLPVSTASFVVGKFLACTTLLLLALALTAPLPLTVSQLGDLDWGPVWAGYLGAALVGAAYVALGLFVSACSRSQISALIVASVLGVGLYYLDHPLLAAAVGVDAAAVLSQLSSHARFESIARGVLDVRDLTYFLTLTAALLALTVYALLRAGWAADGSARRHRRANLGIALIVANLALVNVWLAPFNSLRLDTTEGRIYSISPATQNYLDQLTEPLLIRAYLSERTHPLLAPLAPRLADLLREFEVAGTGRVRVEILDPLSDPAMEDEANNKYGITPVPFQVADRHQSSLVNAYFDVLLQYGDEFQVLTFQDLIEVKVAGEADLDVELRNPEYDLTRGIKQVLYGFQGGASLFENIGANVEAIAYVSAEARLPAELVAFRGVVEDVFAELSEESQGKFSYQFVDPNAGDGALAAELADDLGMRPMSLSLLDTEGFYFYLTASDGSTLLQLPLPDALSAESFRQLMEDGLQRFATGVLKAVGYVAPQPPAASPFGPPPVGESYRVLREVLAGDFEVRDVDLDSGAVPVDLDALMVIDPTALSERAVFALDQYLMRGGTVLLATAPKAVELSAQSLSLADRDSGLAEWLAYHGVRLSDALVLDERSGALPVPVTREAGGFTFQDIALLDYPYLVDVRDDGLSAEHPATASVAQVTLPWVSAIELGEPTAERSQQVLLRSSSASWLSRSSNLMPSFDAAGEPVFAPEGELASRPLAVLLEGRFESFFDAPPLAMAAEADDEANAESPPEGLLRRSPESARLIVIGSNSFAADGMLQMIGSAQGAIYSNSLLFVSSLVDWAVEDQSLLSIRSRGHFNRTLTVDSDTARFWERINYAAAVVGLLLVYGLWRVISGVRARRRLAAIGAPL